VNLSANAGGITEPWSKGTVIGENGLVQLTFAKCKTDRAGISWEPFPA
jgi:hypothetical protein